MAEEILKERDKLKDFYIIGAKYIAHNCYQEMTKKELKKTIGIYIY